MYTCVGKNLHIDNPVNPKPSNPKPSKKVLGFWAAGLSRGLGLQVQARRGQGGGNLAYLGRISPIFESIAFGRGEWGGQ